MRVISLGSGSSGNALFVESGPQGRTRFLVDAGLGARTIVQRLQAIGISPSWLSGILVTHEHHDHVQGIPLLMKHYAVPVIADVRTLESVEQFIEKVIRAEARRVDVGKIGSCDDLRMVNDTAMPMSETQQVQSESGSPVPVENEATMGTAFETGKTSEATSVASEIASGTNDLFVPFPVGSQRLFGDVDVTSFPTSHDAVAPC